MKKPKGAYKRREERIKIFKDFPTINYKEFDNNFRDFLRRHDREFESKLY